MDPEPSNTGAGAPTSGGRKEATVKVPSEEDLALKQQSQRVALESMSMLSRSSHLAIVCCKRSNSVSSLLEIMLSGSSHLAMICCKRSNSVSSLLDMLIYLMVELVLVGLLIQRDKTWLQTFVNESSRPDHRFILVVKG